jgi:hypothetical protein
MQKSTPDLIWRILGGILVPLYYPEYRKLLIRSYVLSARLQLLCGFVAVISPLATPGLVLMIRRWLDGLRKDVAEYGRQVRTPRAQVALARSSVTPQIGNASGYENPWT